MTVRVLPGNEAGLEVLSEFSVWELEIGQVLEIVLATGKKVWVVKLPNSYISADRQDVVGVSVTTDDCSTTFSSASPIDCTISRWVSPGYPLVSRGSGIGRTTSIKGWRILQPQAQS